MLHDAPFEQQTFLACALFSASSYWPLDPSVLDYAGHCSEPAWTFFYIFIKQILAHSLPSQPEFKHSFCASCRVPTLVHLKADGGEDARISKELEDATTSEEAKQLAVAFMAKTSL